jgi:DNA modification methylase
MINEKIKYLRLDKPTDQIKIFNKIYDLHKYWSRKPWHPISECILKYSNEKDIVLDLFMGSGVTALESTIHNRDFVGFDLNPMSIFISKNTLKTKVSIKDLRKELEIISNKIQPLAEKLYSSKEKCKICNGNLTIQHLNLGPKFKNKETAYLFCQNCGKNKTRTKIKVAKEDLDEANKKYPIKKWIPKTDFPKKFYKDRFSYKGIKKVTDMFTNRNLYLLSELFETIKTENLKYEELFILGFTNTLLHASKLKSENVRPLSVNNYWVPDDYFEENPWLRFLDRMKKIIVGKEILNERTTIEKKLGKATLNNKSSLNTKLAKNSVDYIITDPPYGDAIQYSELSFLWNSWLNKNYIIDEEVIINPVQKKGISEFLEFMQKSVTEASRVLKDNKHYTLCFHNKQFSIWQGVLNSFKTNNFVLENIEIVETKGNSYNSNWSKFSPKTDIYLTFRKSNFKYTHNKEYSIKKILRDILNSNKDLSTPEIYDLLIVELIQEIYFNEYQIDISKLTIKELSSIVEGIKNGN